MIGSTLGHYQIVGMLGEGGMGVVYKARDTHLDRLVAIKVLPAEKVADPERRRRFVQEAKAASALNHANIIVVHDITQADGIDFIVMEHVDGKTLDALIPRSGMRLSELLKVGVQIARALAAAHAHGIIHRDLKPANVMVSPGGTVKVLDFGLAKLTDTNPDAGATDAPTADARTDGGVILGTAAYMSPEQAEGKPVDARSDIFSFGAVLYEMATGRRAFPGDTWASTMSAVLSKDPKPMEGLPHDLEKAILRCLRKDPARRFQHMDDVCVALEELKEDSDSGKLGTALATPARSTWRRRLAYAAVAVSMLLAGASLAWRWAAPAAPAAVPKLVPLTAFSGFERSPSFSPDGRQIVFSWNGPREDNDDIYLMVVGTTTAVRLTTDPAQDLHPVWSPDGRQIAFVRLGTPPVVMLMPPLGGAERVLAETAVASSVSDWLPSGKGIDWSPDGKYVALASRDAQDGPARIVLVSPDTGERRVMTSPPAGAFGDGMPRVSPDGRKLAFLRQRPDLYWDMCIIPLSGQGLTAPFVYPGFKNAFMPAFAWTRDSRELIGPFMYEDWQSRLWRMPADAQGPPVPVVGASGSATDVAIAPQGGYLAFAASVGDSNIWRIEVGPTRSAGAPVKWISSTSWDGTPEYSPDGRRILFGSFRSGYSEVWVSDSDGSNATQLTHIGGPETGSARWSPDGRTIAFDSMLDGQPEIYVITADGGPPRRLTSDPAADFVPTWSRDGRWIYFTSNRSGTRQLWKMPAAGGAAVQVTRHGGVNACESDDGRTLYFAKDIEAAGLWKMPVAGGEEVQVLDVPEARRWGAVAYASRGVYYIARETGVRRAFPWTIFFYDFASQETTRVVQLDKPLGYFARSLALSPDGRWLLFSQVDMSGSDLMLLENFR